MADSFDVFFSYSMRDHAAVERIARDLTDRGIRLFLDRWYLTPGQPWPQALEHALAACKAVAVFIGADGPGPWQQRERDLALDRQAREPGFPVIPVLLTHGDPGLGFLKLNTWVDLSAGIADADALEILTAAIRQQPPGPSARHRIEAVRNTVCPYRGLRPFREEDEPFFFGRASFAETLVAAVARQPFIAVVGASGSGKSSVVRAGLIPRLRRGAGNLVWDALTFVPGDRPLTSLAAALLPALEPSLSEADRLAEVCKLACHLQDGTVALKDVAQRVLKKQPGTDRLLLFIDQWEELYTLSPDNAEPRAFVDHLLQAATTDVVRVVLTLRGDFMGHALANRDLSDQLQDALVTIGPMTRDELAEAIVRPAERVGLGFEAGLVETILDDVGDEPGGLPLLEFQLEGLWAEQRSNVLTHDAYTRLGRVAGAIAQRAEDVFKNRLTDTERETAQRLLIRMVRPGEGVEDTRQRTTVPKADPVAEATVRKLVQERLIVTERDTGSGAVTIELAHEALVRRWERLRNWIDADREFLRTRERIAAQGQLWENEKRAPDRLLTPGRPLAEGEDLLANRRTDLDSSLIEYILASAAAALVDEAARQAAQRRHLRRARLVATAMAILALVAVGGGTIAWWQRGEANRNAQIAQRNAQMAERNAQMAEQSAMLSRRNRSRALAALAEFEVKTGSPATAVRLALAAVPRSPRELSEAYAREAKGAIWFALQHLRELRRIGDRTTLWSAVFSPDGKTLATASGGGAWLGDVAKGEEIVSFDCRYEGEGFLSLSLSDVGILSSPVAFSPNGKTLATACRDNVWLWDVVTGKDIAVLRGHEKYVSSVAFSTDGKTLATASADGTARLWDVAKGKEIVSFDCRYEGEAFPSLSLSDVGIPSSPVAFSPNGKTLATACGDNARLWDVATSQEIIILRGHQAVITSVAFSPDGKTLATASADGTARLWDVATSQEIIILRGHQAGIMSVAFSPDGKTLATASADGTAWLWDVATGEEIDALRGHERSVTSVVFSPDGKTLATASLDKTARLWDVATSQEFVTPSDRGSLRAVAFSPDGKILAMAFLNIARLWDVATGKEIAVLRGHKGWVLSVAFSPDGKTLATTSLDKTARLWDVTTAEAITVLRGHEGVVWSVAFSADGKTLATGSQDNTVLLWNVATGKEIAVPPIRDLAYPVALSPDGKTLATASLDKTARLWDVATGKANAVLSGHQTGIISVAFSPDGKTLATASLDKTARLWEVATGQEINTLRGHQDLVYSAVFSPDGNTLATTSLDKTARLWDVATGREIGTLRGHENTVLSSAFTPDGHWLATASADGHVRVWPLSQDLSEHACARVHEMPLSEENKQRFGIEDEWCTSEVSAALRDKLAMDTPAR